MNSKNTQKSVIPCREQQRKCTPKRKNTHKKKCQNANVVPLEKGTARTKSVVPLEKEQQKSVEVLSFSKSNSKM